MRQLAPLFGISKSAADRIIDHLGPALALRPRTRLAKGTVLIVDGTLVPTRDHTIAERSKNYRYSTNHQAVVDADTRLVVAVGRPLAGNRKAARRGRSPVPRPPSARPSRSPTADTRAPDSSSHTAASVARPNSRTGKRNTTSPTSRSTPASSTSSPA